MSELFKSRLGMLLAGIHLLIFLFCLIDFYLINSFQVPGSILIGMILTAPWNIFTTALALKLSDLPGKGPGNTYQLFFISGIVISALINAFILYLLGFFTDKGFQLLFIKKTKALADYLSAPATATKTSSKPPPLTLLRWNFIRAYPEQWLRIHKRWKTRLPRKKGICIDCLKSNVSFLLNFLPVIL